MEDFNIDLGDLDLSGKPVKRHKLSKSNRAEMKKLGFSDSEIEAYHRTGGDIKAYFFDLMKNCPEAVVTLDGGYLIYDFWDDDPPSREPYYLEISGTFLDSPKQAAEECRVDVRTISRWFNEGLQHFKIDGKVLIPMKALHEFQKKRGHSG